MRAMGQLGPGQIYGFHRLEIMKNHISNLVHSYVQNFSVEIARRMIEVLENVSFPRPGDNIERIQISIIILSKGDLDVFFEILKVAQEDWRDVVVGAGLGGANWRDVTANNSGNQPQ